MTEKPQPNADDPRTAWAEDRTLMANERTYASWLRTGLALIGVALGLHALFGESSPAWLARALATGFLALAALVFLLAWRQARRALQRLHAHSTTAQPGWHLGLLSVLLSAAAAIAAILLWIA